MKRCFVILLLLFPFRVLAAAPQDVSFQLGAGWFYAMEHFDSPSADAFDDAWGISLKTRFGVSQRFALEGNFGISTEFEGNTGAGRHEEQIATLTVDALMIFGEAIRPYLSAGLGGMAVESSTETTTFLPDGRSYRKTHHLEEEDFCTRLGCGLIWDLHPNISLDTAFHYVTGLTDLDHLAHSTFTAGFLFRFR